LQASWKPTGDGFSANHEDGFGINQLVDARKEFLQVVSRSHPNTA
jgi:hypothetical protein